jgi:hypothetical protein
VDHPTSAGGAGALEDHLLVPVIDRAENGLPVRAELVRKAAILFFGKSKDAGEQVATFRVPGASIGHRNMPLAAMQAR